MPLPTQRDLYGEEHSLFRDSVRRLFEQSLHPNLADWEERGMVDRAFWTACGAAGLLCPGVPEALGGLGLDFRFKPLVGEEHASSGSEAGFLVHVEVVAEYQVRSYLESGWE